MQSSGSRRIILVAISGQHGSDTHVGTHHQGLELCHLMFNGESSVVSKLFLCHVFNCGSLAHTASELDFTVGSGRSPSIVLFLLKLATSGFFWMQIRSLTLKPLWENKPQALTQNVLIFAQGK